MTFEKNYFFLISRFILINVSIFTLLIIGKTLYTGTALFNIPNYLFILHGTLITIIFFLMVHSISIKKKILIFKNIFGITIKLVDLKTTKGRKVDYKSLPSNIYNILLRKKYDSTCKITYVLSNKTYSFNGHVLSDKGLKLLLAKTKK